MSRPSESKSKCRKIDVTLEVKVPKWKRIYEMHDIKISKDQEEPEQRYFYMKLETLNILNISSARASMLR